MRALLVLLFLAIALAQTPDEVPSLPGIGTLKTRTLAGYAPANQEYGGALYYLFMESQTQPASSNTILWLNGGPGTSSMFGAFVENGPYWMTANGSWIENAYSWNIDFNVLWVDNPVGTGWSYVNNSAGYVRNMSALSIDLYNSVSYFFSIHPEYTPRLYLFGESYAGHYLPWLAHRIVTQEKPLLELGGIGFGNCWVDSFSQTPTNGQYLYSHGKITLDELTQFNQSMQKYFYLLDERDWLQAFRLDNALFAELVKWGDIGNPFDIRYKHDPTEPPSRQLEKYFLRDDVKSALHVSGKNFSNGVIPYRDLNRDEEKSELYLMARLWAHGVPTLIYNGECDMVCNWMGSQAWAENLVWAGQQNISSAANTTWTVDGVPAGWYRSAMNVTVLVVANAGHMSPFDQPKNVYQMVRAFIQKLSWNS